VTMGSRCHTPPCLRGRSWLTDFCWIHFQNVILEATPAEQRELERQRQAHAARALRRECKHGLHEKTCAICLGLPKEPDELEVVA
jgi:hypothetical protein